MEEEIDLRDPHEPIGDDGAIEILVHALGDQPLVDPGMVADQALPALHSPVADIPVADSPVADSPDLDAPAAAGDPATNDRAVALKGLESLPRSMRRRMDVCFGDGEEVECAVLGEKQGGTDWILGTTHRIVVAPPGPRVPGVAALTLPYHRTTASVSETGTIELHSNEFDRTRSAVIEPRAGFVAETSHLLARIADA